MSFAALKIKIMPTSPQVKLEEIRRKSEEKIIKLGGKIEKTEQQEVAFGLKAIIITLAWPEEQETDLLEKTLQEIPDISSTQILDYRRAFG